MISNDPSAWIVLVIDDDADNLEVAQAVLKFNGSTVHTATNGVHALEVLKDMDELPTLVLADLSMPQMSGWDLLKNMRADERLKGIPVIALTAHAMSDDRDRVFEAGFDGYITKPFWIHTLLNDIRRSLSKLDAAEDGDEKKDSKSKKGQPPAQEGKYSKEDSDY